MTLADTPITWQDPPPMSTLHAVLLFVGVPALIFVVISCLVMAPSLVRGPSHSPGQDWDAEPEQFGALPVAPGTGPDRQLEGAADGGGREQASGATSARLNPDTHDAGSTGGASATW